ncbi:hypothetical protein IMZ11_32920 [Microtetraspora sp. AC03309]|uniref:permease-like cell division protein FtsX n=1 Tax=Microtetraspora sp. AC03309 TaxID=2779376 RepID=UPI001E59641E|nr:permease-like cell division protein FtsX [Microtetraspora sp. AC03309]MCC5580432.1 hypothetical protein [Microtetraspora sp. AC03309]
MWKPIAAAASMGLLIAGVVADTARYQVPLLPPPDGPWPETGTFFLYLCEDDRAWAGCAGRGAVTVGELRGIERALASLPEITSYRRRTREEALAIARQDYRIGAILTVDFMPHITYGGTLARGDWRALLGELADLPGVGASGAYRDNFWWGKADVSVMLCPKDAVHRSAKRCEGRGRATEAEKEAVLDRIRAVRGIEKIYLEDPAHAAKARDHVEWLMSFGGGDLDELPETFYLTLADPSAVARIEKSLTGMAGVAQVTPVVRP